MAKTSSDKKLDVGAGPVVILGAIQFDMASAISGRTYRIFVVAPASPPPPQGYPVVLVTDAGLTFSTAATMNLGFTMAGGPAALVVGIGYPADDMLTPMMMRTRDLTPPTPLSAIPANPALPPPSADNFGGADLFRRFIVEELRPALAATWSTDPANQTLFGHSLGGLFALGVMFSHPKSFRTFVASSPSIWWNNRALLDQVEGFEARVKAGEAAPRVLITIGASEQDVPATPPPGMSAEQAAALVAEAKMVDNARDLAQRLAAIPAGEGYEVRYVAFGQEDHMTVVPAAVSRAMAFALRG